MKPARHRLRLLNEGQVRRVLASGGMLLDCGGQWRAFRTHDARRGPAGRTTPLIVNRLRAEKAVRHDPDRLGRLIAGCVEAPPVASVQPPAYILRASPLRPPAPLFTELAREMRDDPAGWTRLQAAADRFCGEVVLACVLPAVSVGRLGQRSPSVAISRLADLEATLGLPVFRMLESLLVDTAPAAAFARQFGCSEAEGKASALAALRSLAAAYNLAPMPPRR